MNIYSLLEYLETEIANAANVPLMNGRAMVNREKCLEILDEVRLHLPEDIREARAMVERQQTLMADSERHAKTTVEEANLKAQNTMQEARIQSENMVKEAREQSKSMMTGAEAQAKQMVEEAERRAQALTEENEITQRAYAKAEQVLSNAQRNARDIRLGANEYADDVLGDIEKMLGRQLEQLVKNRQELRRSGKR